MKKITCLALTLFCVLAVFCGCDFLNKQPTTLADSITIPENGIIDASVFEVLKAQNKAVTFKGQCGDIRYEWIVFGSDIKEAKTLNLGIEITEADDEKLSFRFLSEEDFGFCPMLSIYQNGVWNAQSASASGGEIKQEVTVTVEKRQTILNFSPKVQTGTFVITPNTDTASDEPSSEASTVSDRPISDGKGTEQDKYHTDPVPEGRPLPVEPDNGNVDTEKTYTCTLSIECTSIFNHLSELEPEKLDILPKDGIIFAPQTVTFYEGESVYDVLMRVCKENRIHMEASLTPMYNSAYVEGIGNLYEFDCGSGSGWMYRVDGWYPNYGCSRYQLKQGETIEWRYTCDLGNDIGGGCGE